MKDQQQYVAEAEDSKRNMEQYQLKITEVEKENETENIALKSINNAITELKEGVSRFDMPTLKCFFVRRRSEEGLHRPISYNTINSRFFHSTRPYGILSQVCDKVKKVFAKWQALSNVSLDYFSSSDV